MEYITKVAIALIAVAASTAQADYVSMIKTEARRQGVDPLIAVAVAKVESSLNPRARKYEPKLHRRLGGMRIDSTSLGLFQVIPAYHKKRCGVRNAVELLTPKTNIRCGIGYLRICSDKHESLKGAMKCYNGGSDYYYMVRKVLEG